MAGYTEGPVAHPSFGSAVINGQLLPIWEAGGVFAARALGPIVRSNGYPSPATLPAGLGSSGMGYGASSGGSSSSFSWGLVAALVAVSVVGILIVHHLHWRA